MLNHAPPYRWHDHVITPRRATLNLMATVPIALAVGAVALFGSRGLAPASHLAIATEHTPSLAQMVKRPPAKASKPIVPESVDGC
jgi:hypothetical protein